MPIRTVRVTSRYFQLNLRLSNLRTVQLWTRPCCFSYFKNTELLKFNLFFQLGIRWLDFALLCISWQNQLKSMITDWFLHHLVELESTVLLLQKSSNWSLVKHYQEQYCWRQFMQLFWTHYGFPKRQHYFWIWNTYSKQMCTGLDVTISSWRYTNSVMNLKQIASNSMNQTWNCQVRYQLIFSRIDRQHDGRIDYL